MSHPQQLEFFAAVKEHLPGLFEKCSVLEVGSFDVNGSIRQFFSGGDFWGIDLMPGPGVDEVVPSGHEFHPRAGRSFDVTVSTECFEHNPFYLETLVNMIRLTRKGGAVLFTCASRGRGEHGTARTSPDASPGTQTRGWNYYRNLVESDFTSKVDFGAHFANHRFFYNPVSCDLYFIGLKHPEPGQPSVDSGQLQRAYGAVEERIAAGMKNPAGRKLRALDQVMSRVLVKDALYQNVWAVGARPRMLNVWKRFFGSDLS